jgi:hypothetical protein
MSSATETHTVELRTSVKNETASSANDAWKGTVTIIALITMIPTDNVPWSEDTMKGESEISLMT